VRMWDSKHVCYRFFSPALSLIDFRFCKVRTGQAQRTLMGHTAPVTCLQFDEIHIVSGSLDKTVRVRTVIYLQCFEHLTSHFDRYGTCVQVVSLKPSSTTTQSLAYNLTVER